MHFFLSRFKLFWEHTGFIVTAHILHIFKYGTLTDLENTILSNDGNGKLTFKDVSAEAEYKAWTDLKKANVGNGKGFGAFLLSEKNSFSGHYTFGNINVPKLAVYGVLFGALFLIVKK